MCGSLITADRYLNYVYLAAVLMACLAFIPWILTAGAFKVNFRSKFLLIGLAIAFGTAVLAGLISTAAQHLC
jgi:hypothetical protein